MLNMLSGRVGIDDDVVEIHVHPDSNIRCEQVIHERLVSRSSIAITLLHDFADHCSVGRVEQRTRDMFWDHTNLLVRVLTVDYRTVRF